MTSLCIEYIGEFITLNQKDLTMFLGDFFYKFIPQLIKFNIPTNDLISFPALGGTGVFISGIVNPIINSVKFSFWGSVDGLSLWMKMLISYEVILDMKT